MWGNKKKQTQTSEFFKGTNIFEKMVNSTFGKIKQTFSEIFTQKDIEQYTLPKVIVIGNESTGKSSLLENITKCQLFPRDSKLCTKCPIHIKLSQGSSKYVVSIPKKTFANVVANKSELQKNNVIHNLEKKEDIYGVIYEYMNSLPVDYISDKEITVEITDKDMPTFEFYDLPGIRTYPPETAETTTKLCKKYLSDKNSIVLCVVPATTTRLTSCQSIALISEMNMEHNCILALTMADRLQSENIEELLIKRIIQTSDELNGLNFAGYVAVVNRVHSDLHSLEENDKNETLWFDNNILQYIPDEYLKYEQQIKDNITIVNLISKMDVLYNKFIHQDWKPRILKTITNKLNELESKYKELGDCEVKPDKLNIIINNFIAHMFTNVKKTHYHAVAKIDDLFSENDEEECEEDEEKICDKENCYCNGQGKCSSIKREEEMYYRIIKVVNNETQKYANFDIAYIIKMIEEFFDKEQRYKIKRFVNVKNDLINKMENKFKNLTHDNIQKINHSIKDYILNKYLDDKMTQQADYYNEIFSLYKLFVLYPLLKMQKFDYTKDDYVEGDEYKQKREDLLEAITKTKKHYDFILSLT